MIDHAVGVAILDKRANPERLLVLCKPIQRDRPMEQLIPVYPKGSPKPETYNGAAWEYSIEGDTLHITPSLHVRWQQPNGEWLTEFHNGFNWSVKFQLADDRPVNEEWDAKHLYEQLREANG
jgi:hypothetical protein